MRAKLLTPLLAAFGAMPALAHVNDRGTDYSAYDDHNGAPSCDDRDCRPADDSSRERRAGSPAADRRTVDRRSARRRGWRGCARWTGALVRREALYQLASRLGTVPRPRKTSVAR